MKNWLTYAKRALAVLLIVAAAALCFLVFLFRNELKTLRTFEKIDDNIMYTMEYHGDYGLDEFLAQGGASNDQELIDFITKRLLKGLPVKFSAPDLGCSTFSAQTADGDQIFGRNFDLTYSPLLFVKTTPENGYASVSAVNLGFLGYGEDKLPDSFLSQIMTLAAPFVPLDGINEAGLTIAVLKIEDTPTNQTTDKTDITTTTAIRMILDQCATVDEAVALLQQYDMHSSANSCYHFQIADASGASTIVEYVDNEISILPAKTNFQYATNFLLSPQKYGFPGNGTDRFEILKAKLEETGGILPDEQAAMDLLKAVSQEMHLNSKGKESATQWSIVYNNTDLTASVITQMQYHKPAHQFSLK